VRGQAPESNQSRSSGTTWDDFAQQYARTREGYAAPLPVRAHARARQCYLFSPDAKTHPTKNRNIGPVIANGEPNT
jgi:hypothetical protein